MNTLVFPALETVDNPVTRYELPPEGITTLGYLVRRMHKTEMLSEVEALIQAEQYRTALVQVALYAAAAAVSFGALHYEPTEDQIGSTVTERDPRTSAIVTATLVNQSPNEYYSLGVKMPDQSCFYGFEHATDSRIGFRGWVLPAKASFMYVTNDEGYRAVLTGRIIREVVPRIVGPWHSRAHGSLDLSDNFGNSGTLVLSRNAEASVSVNQEGEGLIHQVHKLS